MISLRRRPAGKYVRLIACALRAHAAPYLRCPAKADDLFCDLVCTQYWNGEFVVLLVVEVEDVGGVWFVGVPGEDDGAGLNVDGVGGWGVREEVEGILEGGGDVGLT